MKKTKFIAVILTAIFIVAANSNVPEKQNKKMIKPALLVIDIQNQYLAMVSSDDKDMAMMVINWTIGMFREKGFPVIRVYNTDPQYGPKPGTEAFEFPASVLIKPDDPKIIKNYASAFKKTDLDKMLREKGCNTLFLCGLSSVGCVLATYFGAMDLDYDVFMVKDALLSHKSAYTDSIEDILNAVGYNTLKVMLENAE